MNRFRAMARRSALALSSLFLVFVAGCTGKIIGGQSGQGGGTAQTISFAAVGSQTVGAQVTLFATASSGLSVSFASETTSVCTVSGNTAMMIASGTCTLEATQAGNSQYEPASAVQDVAVGGKAQTITFANPGTQTMGTAVAALMATASSGLPVSFSTETTGVCSVSGTVVTLVASGTCSIQATQPGSTTYAAATPVTQSFTVLGEPQTITFASIASQAISTTPTLTLPAPTASSGLPVALASMTTGTCSVSGTTVTLLAIGTCSIQATQPGNSTWAAATPIEQSFIVNGEPQTITFAAIANQTISATPTLTLPTPTATSGLAVTLTSMTTGTCSVSGTTVTLLTAGTCSIQATQPGNTIWAAATPVTQSFTILGGGSQSQTITFNNPGAQTVGTPLTLVATASSGLPVAFASQTTNVCTVSGTTATFVSAGTCTIQATQPGNATYAAATPVSDSFTVNAAALLSQTITFGTIATQTVGTPLTLAATASSGLPVAFASQTTSVCAVSGTTATFVSAGTCTIQATQAGNTERVASSGTIR